MTAEYGGAVYSVSLQVSNLGMPVDIEVFESTNSSDVLRISDYSVIVTGAKRDGRVLEILERASVHNDSDRTLVPDLQGEGPAMLSFLRFALPRGATHLDVRSNLVGGDVLEVDRGFAVSVPVPPTPQDQPHRFEFVYRLAYDDGGVDLSRTLRFGAESLRFVVPVDTGTGVAPELADLGVADLTGRRLQLLEGAAFAPGEQAELRVVGLPQPTLLDRIGSASGRAYLAYALPSAAGAALLALLLIGSAERQGPPQDGQRGVGSQPFNSRRNSEQRPPFVHALSVCSYVFIFEGWHIERTRSQALASTRFRQ